MAFSTAKGIGAQELVSVLMGDLPQKTSEDPQQLGDVLSMMT